MRAATPCVCGHQKDAHEHYRPGTDCALCGAEVCPRYRRSRAGAVDPGPDSDATGGAGAPADEQRPTRRLTLL